MGPSLQRNAAHANNPTISVREQEGMLDDIPLDEDYSSGSEDGDEEGGEDEDILRAGGGGVKRERERRAVDYKVFHEEMWPKIAKARPEAKELSPANLFQEIHSYDPNPTALNHKP